MTTTIKRLRQNERRLDEAVDRGEVSEADGEAIHQFVRAYDEEDGRVEIPIGVDANGRKEGPKKPNTLSQYYRTLLRPAREIELTDTSAAELNDLFRRWIGDELQKSSVTIIEGCVIRFYRYHREYGMGDLGVDPDSIYVHRRDGGSFSPRDMLDAEERADLRAAAKEPRDAVVVDLLLYTGMRNTALRTLRVGDVDLEEGRFYFNTSADGLKNISEPEVGRPLLRATAAVREWMKYHPTGEDDHYLITAIPGYAAIDATEPVASNTISRVMSRVSDRAGIDKPTTPHMMRHNAVTAWREEDVPWDRIKFMLGHSPESTIAETTYSHLSGEDHAKRMEIETGQREPEEDERESRDPDPCPICDTVPRPGAMVCDYCSNPLRPEATQVQREVQQDIGAEKALNMADLSDEEIEAIADDDAILAKLIEIRSG